MIVTAFFSVVRADSWWSGHGDILNFAFSINGRDINLCCLHPNTVPDIQRSSQWFNYYYQHHLGAPRCIRYPLPGSQTSPQVEDAGVSYIEPAELSILENLTNFSLSKITYSRVTKLGVSDTEYVEGTQFLLTLKHHLVWEPEMNNKEMSFHTQFSKQGPNNTQPPPSLAFCRTSSPWQHHNRLNKSSEDS